jgi:hypothetical protein
MDYALIGTIARLTNTRPNWDREVTRAVGAARVCAIAALIRALGGRSSTPTSAASGCLKLGRSFRTAL